MLLHWFMAVGILGLFGLGLYMVELDYYHQWYQAAPNLHRSIGVVIALLLLVRLVWRLVNPMPTGLGKRWEVIIAHWVHRLFYGLIIGIIVSGYLITTADGQSVSVFGLFELPALLDGFENQEDIAGEVHEWLTNTLMVLVALHALAALKHHFVDQDATLRRMIGRKG